MNDKKIKVKISCLHDMPPLLRQLPDKSTILGNCEFLINTNERDCDFFFVLHGVERPELAKCPSENVVLVTGEPESVFRCTYLSTVIIEKEKNIKINASVSVVCRSSNAKS